MQTPKDSKPVSFFVMTPLGLESHVAQELEEVWPWLKEMDGQNCREPLPLFKRQKGGLEFEAPLHLGLQLNFYSRTAGRILLRWKKKRVRDFPTLFRFAKAWGLESCLPADTPLVLEVSASRSRLGQERRIKETLSEALVQQGFQLQEEREEAQRIFIRFFDDECQVSLDSSGAHLHKRGYRLSQAPAPLRENLAAILLRDMAREVPLASLNEVSLWDPMCGSGTFLWEGALFGRPTTTRSFAFQTWRQCPAFLRSGRFLKSRFEIAFSSLRGGDEDAERAREWAAQQDHLPVDGGRFSLLLQSAKEWSCPQERTWLCLNPPFGRRLEADTKGLRYQLETWSNWPSVERIGFLSLQEDPVRFKFDVNQWRERDLLFFRHGGLHLQWRLMIRRKSLSSN